MKRMRNSRHYYPVTVRYVFDSRSISILTDPQVHQRLAPTIDISLEYCPIHSTKPSTSSTPNPLLFSNLRLELLGELRDVGFDFAQPYAKLELEATARQFDNTSTKLTRKQSFDGRVCQLGHHVNDLLVGTATFIIKSGRQSIQYSVTSKCFITNYTSI